MQIKYGAEVVDKNGRLLGTVDHLMHNTLTGEVSKFVVNRKPPHRDLFFSPQDVLEVKNSKIKVNISRDELSKNR
ncbi:MAG: PRC-barrel domain-containing protein [Dehalococcoidia bacterium]|nr:PRC-barrel domain-containing protein [Dehalococcoidia bacterium]